MKRFFAYLTVCLLLLGCFAGCAAKGGQDATEASVTVPDLDADTTEAPAGTDATNSVASDGDLEAASGLPASDGDLQVVGREVTVALVIAGTFGDRSFYDSSREGAEKLKSDYEINLVSIECNNENFEAQMRNAADLADIVVCVGWEFWAIEEIAPEYRNVHWIWIDNETEAPVDNVLNIVYAQNEGSFLAGYIAAAMSESGVIGAVGGEDSDTINDFIVGYRQGAEYYDPDVKVEVNYADTYDDPTKGKECAFALNDKGADVIFQIASATGDGVFEAAAERGFYAIGVDSDQKFINDEVIICSMKKEVGRSIYHAVESYLRGDVSAWGTTWIADMSNGYVGIGYGDEGAKQQVSEELKHEVNELAEQIVIGAITVETTRK